MEPGGGRDARAVHRSSAKIGGSQDHSVHVSGLVHSAFHRGQTAQATHKTLRGECLGKEAGAMRKDAVDRRQ